MKPLVEKKSLFVFFKNKSILTRKLAFTLLSLLIFRFGNAIPLEGIDHEALKKAFLQIDTKNSVFQILNMYTGSGGKTLISSFSLGIIPFINASIIIDLLTAIFPYFEKLQTEEGEKGRQKLYFYKKLVSFVFAIGQSFFLLSYLKPYLYEVNNLSFFSLIVQLVAGSMVIIWLTNIIDTKGIGNGTSIIIFTNIITSFIGKSNNFSLIFDEFLLLQIVFLFLLILFICISQTIRLNIELVSARQLMFLKTKSETSIVKKENSENVQLNETGLAIRLNQAGIFPIIIASNILPFLSFFKGSIFSNNQIIPNSIYYLLILVFNYFYTLVFWDPEKIAEQLRKASVAILDITPGEETIKYLNSVVKGTSILGGILLCLILYVFDSVKQLFSTASLLDQINISSLIILIGVAYELQKTIRSFAENYPESMSLERNSIDIST